MRDLERQKDFFDSISSLDFGGGGSSGGGGGGGGGGGDFVDSQGEVDDDYYWASQTEESVATFNPGLIVLLPDGTFQLCTSVTNLRKKSCDIYYVAFYRHVPYYIFKS